MNDRVMKFAGNAASRDALYAVVLAAGMLTAASHVAAQQYPVKVVRYVVPFTAGSACQLTAD